MKQVCPCSKRHLICFVTGVNLLNFSKRGRAEKGVEEVRFHGFDEKRQITLTPIIDGEGEVVGSTQCIWGGEEGCTGACPDDDTVNEFPNLYHTQTKTHWCTFGSLVLLVTTLWQDHVKPSMEAVQMDISNSYWILILDCYSVHICQEFLQWAKSEFPLLILLFIPATLTAWLQPLDISFNGPFKLFLRNVSGMWLAGHIEQQLREVEDPRDVKLDVRLRSLRPLLTEFLSRAMAHMADKQQLIMRGWNDSGMGKAFVMYKEGESSAEFQKAKQLEAEGKLFEQFTMKKQAQLAESVLAGRT